MPSSAATEEQEEAVEADPADLETVVALAADHRVRRRDPDDEHRDPADDPAHQQTRPTHRTAAPSNNDEPSLVNWCTNGDADAPDAVACGGVLASSIRAPSIHPLPSSDNCLDQTDDRRAAAGDAVESESEKSAGLDLGDDAGIDQAA